MNWLKAMLASARNRFRSDPWGSFDAQAWRELPHVAGRPATQADVKEGRAAFYLTDSNGGGAQVRPYEMVLPASAIHHDTTTGVSTPVVIIQAECAFNTVVVGFRLLRGGNGVATLPEMELLASPDDRFFVTGAALSTTADNAPPGTQPPAAAEEKHPPLSKTPEEECEALMSRWLIPVATKMLAEHGEFYPIGGVMQMDGIIAAVSTYDGDEHPPSSKVIDSLMGIFRAGAKQKKYKATGLAYDVRTIPPGATEKTGAVAVRLDHVSGCSVIVMHSYRISSSQEVVFSPPFASKGPADIFQLFKDSTPN